MSETEFERGEILTHIVPGRDSYTVVYVGQVRASVSWVNITLPTGAVVTETRFTRSLHRPEVRS